MKRVLINSITYILLISILLFSIMSCKKEKTQNETDSVSESIIETYEPDLTETVLIKEGEFLYSLIRSEYASKIIQDSTTELYKKICSVTGLAPEYKTDFIMPGETADNDNYEILVGKTVRSQSVSVLNDLKALDYYIGVYGKKIIILGGSDEATITAINVFVEQIIDKITMPTDNSDLKLKISEIYYKAEYVGEGTKIGNYTFNDYNIVYTETETIGELQPVVEQLCDIIRKTIGTEIPIKKATTINEIKNEIVVGKTLRSGSVDYYKKETDPFKFSIKENDGKLYICGGSDWSIQYAVEVLEHEFFSCGKSIPINYEKNDTAYGKELFQKAVDSNIRIMTNNVWYCDSNVDAWQNIGENCSAINRAIGFAEVYLAYRPDVVNFQEMSNLMLINILKNMTNSGVVYSSKTFQHNDSFTCFIYNPNTVTLLDSGFHMYEYGNNGNSKSYTWGYFQILGTDKTFISLTTHLWWKSESAQIGSDELRRRQAAEIVEVTNDLEIRYNCPIFVAGDLNTRTTSTAFSELISGGFSNCYDIATEYADSRRGYHSCGPEGFSKETEPGDYKTQSIDHILVRNAGASEIKEFQHIIPYFYVKLSDHYPLYIDAVIN